MWRDDREIAAGRLCRNGVGPTMSKESGSLDGIQLICFRPLAASHFKTTRYTVPSEACEGQALASDAGCKGPARRSHACTRSAAVVAKILRVCSEMRRKLKRSPMEQQHNGAGAAFDRRPTATVT